MNAIKDFISPMNVSIVTFGLCGLGYWTFLNLLPSPHSTRIHPSISSFQGANHTNSIVSKLQDLYPEDLYGGGSYAPLPFGKVKYWIEGPESGPKVVLIHGISMPSVVWSEIVPHLTAAGFRVLLYDVYGRGYSEAPEESYTASFLAAQLASLMQYIRWERAHIVGLSMGGGIAAQFVSSYPWLVQKKAGFIAPAGIIPDGDVSWVMRLLLTPLGQYVVTTSLVRRLIVSRAEKISTGNDRIDRLLKTSALQAAILPHYIRAIASTLRDGPIRGQQKSYTQVGQNTDIEVLLIWGTKDTTVPFYLSVELQRRMPRATLVTVPEGGHDITVTHQGFVSRTLLDFLSS